MANSAHAGAIPESVFEKPPSAELRPDQKDSDSLPPYEVLDQMLRAATSKIYEAPAQIAREAQPAARLRCRDIVDTKWTATNTSANRPRPGLKVTYQGVRHRPALSHRAKVLRITNEYRGSRVVSRWQLLAAVLIRSRRRANKSGRCADGGFLLNSGWRIRPAGTQVPARHIAHGDRALAATASTCWS